MRCGIWNGATRAARWSLSSDGPSALRNRPERSDSRMVRVCTTAESASLHWTSDLLVAMCRVRYLTRQEPSNEACGNAAVPTLSFGQTRTARLHGPAAHGSALWYPPRRTLACRQASFSRDPRPGVEASSCCPAGTTVSAGQRLFPPGRCRPATNARRLLRVRPQPHPGRLKKIRGPRRSAGDRSGP
jgi:hypothetical protein